MATPGEYEWLCERIRALIAELAEARGEAYRLTQENRRLRAESEALRHVLKEMGRET